MGERLIEVITVMNQGNLNQHFQTDSRLREIDWVQMDSNPRRLRSPGRLVANSPTTDR
jgi:hypothetical protein